LETREEMQVRMSLTTTARMDTIVTKEADPTRGIKAEVKVQEAEAVMEVEVQGAEARTPEMIGVVNESMVGTLSTDVMTTPRLSLRFTFPVSNAKLAKLMCLTRFRSSERSSL
jgi:hypothetical protein